jgi:EpsI family protein
VVFLACIGFLFGLAALMLRLQPAPRMALSEALDLDLHAVWPEFLRLRFVRPSAALITAALMAVGLAAAWTLSPPREAPVVNRQPLDAFPREVADWRAVGIPRALEPQVEKALGADDYISLNFARTAAEPPVELFSAWYLDQTKGGIHSPEVCLPGGGWEMTSIRTVDIGPRVGAEGAFNVNRAVITKNMNQLLVYYWFDQSGRHIASDYLAKAMLVWSGITEGRTDGALVRVTTAIMPSETPEAAEERLLSFLIPAAEILPRHVDGRP